MLKISKSRYTPEKFPMNLKYIFSITLLSVITACTSTNTVMNSNANPPPKQLQPPPEYIGEAWMLDDGTIEVNFEIPVAGLVARSHLTYPPDDPLYERTLRHIGGSIKPGKKVGFPPFPDEDKLNNISPKQLKPLPEYIGSARMRDDGTLELNLRYESDDGVVGHGFELLPPDHPLYKERLRHIGPIKPGQEVGIRPFVNN
jgi:hypothetical protein